MDVVLAGWDARRPTRRRASTARGGQRGSAPGWAADTHSFYARVLNVHVGPLIGQKRLIETITCHSEADVRESFLTCHVTRRMGRQNTNAAVIAQIGIDAPCANIANYFESFFISVPSRYACPTDVMEIRMLYLKQNLSELERGLRLFGAATLAATAFVWFSTGWLVIALWASAVTLAATSIVGCCPMCAMAGRRPNERAK